MVSGKIKKINDDNILNDNDLINNKILTCNSIPTTDIEISSNYIKAENFFQEQVFPCKIDDIIFFNKNYLRLDLRIPPGKIIKYNPGQYFKIIYKNIERSYSVANIFERENILSFYIKNYEGGIMSNYLFDEAVKDQLLRIKGPYGSFFMRNEIYNIVFMATGTGIAPIKSILDDLNFKCKKRLNISLFWGLRKEEDFFWIPNYKNLKIKFYKIVSRPDNPNYKYTGYVQDYAVKFIKDFTNYNIFACGSIDMINDSIALLKNFKLNRERFYSDAFVESK